MAASAAGGGTVVFPAGEYLSHSIRLRSWVTLEFRAGATLIAADPPRAGESGGYDAPEPGEPNVYQDFGHSRFHNSLIWGEKLEGVGLRGPGRIFGRGLSRGNGRIALPVGQVAPQPDGRLPDVLEADGPIAVENFTTVAPGAFGYPHVSDTLPPGVGNKAVALRECRGVTIRDLTILHGGHFAILASACDNVVIDAVFIDTNRDGIDVDACANVRITNCSVNSPWDDGICVKSSCGAGLIRPAENVTISNCYVSGFVEGTLYDGTRSREVLHRGGPIGRIKLGTEATGGFRNITISNCVFEFCRGLALEQVDGGPMEDIAVSNLTMREVMNAPIFIRLAGRLRSPLAECPGTAARISISNVVAYDVVPDHGIFIAGIDGYPVRDIQLSGIQLHCRGGGTRDHAERVVPPMVDGYPEPILFGPLPAWGLFIRHAKRVRLNQITLQLINADQRPPVRLEDLDEVDLADVRVAGETSPRLWAMNRVRSLRLHRCDGME